MMVRVVVLSLLALCLSRECAGLSPPARSTRLKKGRGGGLVAVDLSSRGEAAPITGASLRRNISWPLDAVCEDGADCLSGICDVDGSHGCLGQCISHLDSRNLTHCMIKRLGQRCSYDFECESAICDTSNIYGCKNLCVSEVIQGTRNCATKSAGEPCTHYNQCKSRVCDTGNNWGCRDLCVSEPDESGINRHCEPRKVGQTCAHDENCASGSCDNKGLLEDGRRCKGRCGSNLEGCARQHCGYDCQYCLANLTGLPNGTWGSGFGQWVSHHPDRVQHEGAVKSMWLREYNETFLYMRIPASCVTESWGSQPMTQCVEVQGTLDIHALGNAQLALQSALFTGFPQPRPPIDLARNNRCPRRPDNILERGGHDCCYSSDQVSRCRGSPYGKDCERYLVGGVVLASGNRSDDAYASNTYLASPGWSWQQRPTSYDLNGFEQRTTAQGFDHGDWDQKGQPLDFSMEDDKKQILTKQDRRAGLWTSPSWTTPQTGTATTSGNGRKRAGSSACDCRRTSSTPAM